MNKFMSVLNYEDVLDEDIYKEVWIPVGDEKELDILHLIVQNRLRK